MAGAFDNVIRLLTGSGSGEKPRLENAQDQTQEEKDLASWVRQKLEERRMSAARSAMEAVWLTNSAYLSGIDSVEFDAQTKKFKAVSFLPRGINRSRSHVNKILPTCQNRLAKLCKNVPRWDVRPKSSDDADKEAARLGKAVILQDWDYCKINQKRADLLMWAMQCGHAYLKVSWDDSLGPAEIIESQSPNEMPKRVTLGDKRVDVVSAFSCFPDELAKTWDEVNDFIEANVRPLQYFKDRYERGYLVKEEDTWLTSLTYEARINAFNTNTGGAGATHQKFGTAIEISYYEKPSKKHPLGRHVITANGVILKDGVLPIDEIPFAKFDDIKIAGKYASESVITHIRPMQDQYNRNKSLKAAFINRLLMGKYLAARGHGIGAESFNDQSGEVVEYDHIPGATEPKALDAPNMPNYVFEEDQSLIGDINDVSGINQTSRGQMESASIPAIGMQMLIEQDDTRIGIETEHHEYAYANVGRILLKFTAGYYTDERLLKEAGQGFEYIVRKFKGDDLKDNFDVHVVRGSTVPGSKVLERQNIMQLHKDGYFGNPTDPKVIDSVLSMLEFGDEFEIWKEHSLNMAQIQKGISKLEDTGAKPACSEFDNHPMWIRELNLFRLSDRYERLGDQAKQAVIECMNDHVNELQRMVMPETMEDPKTDPELQPTDAAERMAAGADPSGSVLGAAPSAQNVPPPQQEIL